MHLDDDADREFYFTAKVLSAVIFFSAVISDLDTTLISNKGDS